MKVSIKGMNGVGLFFLIRKGKIEDLWIRKEKNVRIVKLCLCKN